MSASAASNTPFSLKKRIVKFSFQIWGVSPLCLEWESALGVSYWFSRITDWRSFRLEDSPLNSCQRSRHFPFRLINNIKPTWCLAMCLWWIISECSSLWEIIQVETLLSPSSASTQSRVYFFLFDLWVWIQNNAEARSISAMQHEHSSVVCAHLPLTAGEATHFLKLRGALSGHIQLTGFFFLNLSLHNSSGSSKTIWRILDPCRQMYPWTRTRRVISGALWVRQVSRHIIDLKVEEAELSNAFRVAQSCTWESRRESHYPTVLFELRELSWAVFRYDLVYPIGSG